MQRKVVLIVEDDQENREVFELMLREILGVSVVAAGSGHEALEIVGQVQPDLVLLDLGLPGMSGLELARELRARYGTLSTPIVAVTASLAVQREALDAGCDSFVKKPFDIERLLAVITGYLCPLPTVRGAPSPSSLPPSP